MMAAQVLVSAATSIFEQLAFVVPDTEAESTPVPARAEARVAFHGPLTGELLVRVYGSVLSRLSANMLGQRGAPDPALQRDALGEIANVVCGNLLPRLAGTQAVFRLAAPVVTVPPGPRRAAEPAARAVLGLDGGRAEVELFLAPGDGP